ASWVWGVPWPVLSSSSTSRVPNECFCTARAKPSSPTDRSSSSGTGTRERVRDDVGGDLRRSLRRRSSADLRPRRRRAVHPSGFRRCEVLELRRPPLSGAPLIEVDEMVARGRAFAKVLDDVGAERAKEVRWYPFPMLPAMVE